RRGPPPLRRGAEGSPEAGRPAVPPLLLRRGTGGARAEAGVEGGAARRLRGLGHRVHRGLPVRGPPRPAGLAVLRGRAESVVRGAAAGRVSAGMARGRRGGTPTPGERVGSYRPERQGGRTGRRRPRRSCRPPPRRP